MIPRTYPSTIDPVSGEAQMVVKKLTSVIGLTRWIDYIPVKYNTDETAGGTYNTSVYVDPFVTGTQAWVDHIPVYEDSSATDAWVCSDTGYIPYGTAAVVAAQAVLKGPKCVLWQEADLSTLFQDSAGTTPVTAVEQPVGRVLDKSGNGRHFIQATPASRPTLSSRYNLLTKTEQFDDAAWSKSNSTVTANAVTAPDGTLTADKLVENSATNYHFVISTSFTPVAAASYTLTVYLKAAERSFACVQVALGGVASLFCVNLTTGATSTPTGGGTATVAAPVDGWYRVSFVFTTASSVAGTVRFYTSNVLSNDPNYLGDGASGVYVWGASLVTAADASLPYQRVNTTTDYDFDFTKFPPYLRFDGVDDSRASAATVDLAGTDKITVVGAWHKASDAATGTVLEFSSDFSANSGTFALAAPNSSGATTISSISRGTVTSVNAPSGLAAPISSVISQQLSIASDQNTLRRNGVQIGSVATDQGTGNFGNHTLFVGSRAGSSLRFNGREYGFAVFNTTLTSAELAAVEAYFRAKSRAY